MSLDRRTTAIRRLPSTGLVVLIMASAILLCASPRGSATEGTQVIYVDQASPEANDSNPGTSSQPLETIPRALFIAGTYNTRSIPVQIIIRPGVYRESAQLSAVENTTSAPITLAGAGPGVVVSGSEIWHNWVGGADGIYSHPWPYDWGFAPASPDWPEYVHAYLDANPVIRRHEMIFVNGIPLLQVLSADEMRIIENSFFVSEEADQVFINVPSDMDIATAQVEVAIRPNLLVVEARQNVSIENITFQHAASPLLGAAVRISGSENVSVIDSRFVANNTRGLGLSESANVMIRGSAANSNGVSGLTGFRISDLRVLDTEASYNGWRAARGWDTDNHESAVDLNLIDFAAGQKFFGLRRATFRNYRAVENLTGGLWLDYDNSDVTLEHLTLRGNLTHGLFLEASQGPISVQSSQICGNETGILVGNASDVHVTGNVLAGNKLGQLFLVGANGPRSVVAHDTGEQLSIQTEDWVVQRNEIAVDDGDLALGTILDGDLWFAFVQSLTSEDNRYSSPRSRDVFQFPGGRNVSLGQWKAETGKDAGSTFTLGRSDCPMPLRGGVGAADDPEAAPLTIALWVATALGGFGLLALWIVRLRRW